MAIQTRRGSYNDFDPEKLLPGEWGTVQSDDPASTDGQSIYMCFAPGQTKRMATYEDMVQNIDIAVEDVKNQFSAGMQAATEAANTAAAIATAATAAANEAADRANTISDSIQSAVEGTLINDMSPSSLTTYSGQKIETDFRKKADTLDVLHGGTGATSAAAARTNLGAASSDHTHSLSSTSITSILPLTKGGTGASVPDSARVNLGFAKQLWSGSWSKGTIVVPDTDKYSLFRIAMDGEGTVIIASKNSNFIRGGNSFPNSASSAVQYHFAATFSGTAWTLGYCTKNNVGSTSFSKNTITSIIGIL